MTPQVILIICLIVITIETYLVFEYIRLRAKWADPEALKARIPVARQEILDFLEDQRIKANEKFDRRMAMLEAEVSKYSVPNDNHE
jgi:hypothetical protein